MLHPFPHRIHISPPIFTPLHLFANRYTTRAKNVPPLLLLLLPLRYTEGLNINPASASAATAADPSASQEEAYLSQEEVYL